MVHHRLISVAGGLSHGHTVTQEKRSPDRWCGCMVRHGAAPGRFLCFARGTEVLRLNGHTCVAVPSDRRLLLRLSIHGAVMVFQVIKARGRFLAHGSPGLMVHCIAWGDRVVQNSTSCSGGTGTMGAAVAGSSAQELSHCLALPLCCSTDGRHGVRPCSERRRLRHCGAIGVPVRGYDVTAGCTDAHWPAAACESLPPQH